MKRAICVMMVLFLVMNTMVYATTDLNDEIEMDNRIQLYYFNIIEGKYEIVELNFDSEKVTPKQLIELLLDGKNIPAKMTDSFDYGISVTEVSTKKDTVFIDTIIDDMTEESYNSFRQSIIETIFFNYDHINEIIFMDANYSKAFPNAEIDYKSAVIRENYTNDRTMIRSIPDVPSPVIVIDPGHGGMYNHAYAEYDGVTYLEKDVVLAIALKLRDRLEGLGATVIMTRTTDTELDTGGQEADCRAKGQVAADNNADMFISIHCNGNDASGPNGVEAYYKPSSYTDSYLSKQLAIDVVANIHDKTGMSIRQNSTGALGTSNYYVFQESECISILVEAGFLTNPSDSYYLINSTGQSINANGIYLGIREFWWGYW